MCHINKIQDNIKSVMPDFSEIRFILDIDVNLILSELNPVNNFEINFVDEIPDENLNEDDYFKLVEVVSGFSSIGLP